MRVERTKSYAVSRKRTSSAYDSKRKTKQFNGLRISSRWHADCYVNDMDIVKPPRPSLWRRRRGLIIGGSAVFLIVVLVGVFGLGQAVPAVERGNLWIDTVQQGDMVREVRATGVLVPKDIRWITAGAVATVQDVVVLPGAEVKADTVILRMINPEVLANLAKANAVLSGAQADVAAARASLTTQLLAEKQALTQAESDMRIAGVKNAVLVRALAAGVVPEIDVRESEIVLDQAKKKVAIGRERVDAMSQNVSAQLDASGAKRDEAVSAAQIAKQQADALTVTAGIDGVLQQVDVEPGQQVQVGAKLARISRPGELLARLQVSEAQAKDLALNQSVKVDTRNGIVEGRVQRIDPAVKNGSVTIDVAFSTALPASARPDLTVEGRIQLGTLRNVISIGRPSSAAPNSESSLFVIRDGKSVAMRVPVKFGATSSDRIEVREGLRPGDQVVLSDTSQWNDFQTLRIR